jgi:hypothetical protein
MRNIGTDHYPGCQRHLFWCPIDGTLRTEHSEPGAHQTNDESPALVSRCREFEDRVPHGAGVIPLWVQTGIAEAIKPPGERTT